MFNNLFQNVSYVNIFIAAVVFLAGLYVAPAVVEKKMNWLLVYPRWMGRIMERYFSASWGFLPVFLIILFLNNVSLFGGFLSGFLIVLPLLGVFLTGLNVSVIAYDLMGWQGVWQILVNPVAWLEFPAAWISYALGFRLAEAAIHSQSVSRTFFEFKQLLPIYLKYVFPLLFVAALLESFLIMLAERYKGPDDPQ